MRICYVLEYYLPHIGGVEESFRQVIDWLAKEGDDISVVTSRLPGTPSFEIMKGVKIYRVDVPHKGDRYWFSLLALPKVLEVARKCDIIHTTTYNAALPAWLASKLLGKPAVMTVHEVFGELWSRLTGMGKASALAHQLFEAIIVSLPFDAYVVHSKYTGGRLGRYADRRKINLSYCAIDEELFKPRKEGRKRIRRLLGVGNSFVYAYYGRPGISKGLEYLIEAVPEIARKIKGSKLLLILSRDPIDRYETTVRRIRELGIGDSVILKDPVPRHELPDYISAADCVVVPSLAEGFGLSAAEGCAMDKPVVASDVASIPEVVSGRHVLVKPRSPEAIAEGVVKVYQGKAKRTPKKRFGAKERAEGHARLYRKLIRT
jgi:glycosyltransferase involved in cell wall biosynthesis